MQCLILAGGLGTRLGELTKATPKPLIRVHGKPFLHYQLEDLAKQGITEVVVSVGYLADQFRESLGASGSPSLPQSLRAGAGTQTVGSGADAGQDAAKRTVASAVSSLSRPSQNPWGLQIQIVDEGDNLLGTGGAIRFAIENSNLGEKFFTIYGDSFLQVDYRKIWNWFATRPEETLMTVIRNNEQWDASNCCFDGTRVTLYDKKLKGPAKPKEMVFIDYGCSIFKKDSILKSVPAGRKMDLADYVTPLSRNGLVAGFEVFERFYEMGSPQGLQEFTDWVSGPQP